MSGQWTGFNLMDLVDGRAVMNRSALQDLLRDDLAGPVGFAFDAMEVAEDVLEDRYGDDEPEGAFLALRVRYEVFGGRTRLLWPHMTEILDRMDAGTDLVPATAAEVLAGLSEMSMARPLGHDLFRVAVLAFVRSFGREESEGLIGTRQVQRVLQDEKDDPRIAEILAELRHEMGDEERG